MVIQLLLEQLEWQSSLFHKPGYSIFLILRTLVCCCWTPNHLSVIFFCLSVSIWSLTTYLIFKVSLVSVPTHKRPQFSFRKLYFFHGIWFSEKTCVPASHSGNKGKILPFLALIKPDIGMCLRFGQVYTFSSAFLVLRECGINKRS